MASDDDGNDPKVGYKRPPVHSRFKSGQSGNPKGRSPKSKNADTLLLAELDRKITITENGMSRTLTKREAFIARLVNGALKGRNREIAIVAKLVREVSPADPIVFTDADDAALQTAIALLQPPKRRRRKE
ncbi:DUF5681 domain-containing protein [uncultured Enterovirga sp.]|uniref:DUF5681 domain-containing protein n=1 Tax=uncultured Enterovirga sp. TaxID=2026352 RepID=UPI0035C9CE6D